MVLVTMIEWIGASTAANVTLLRRTRNVSRSVPPRLVPSWRVSSSSINGMNPRAGTPKMRRASSVGIDAVVQELLHEREAEAEDQAEHDSHGQVVQLLRRDLLRLLCLGDHHHGIVFGRGAQFQIVDGLGKLGKRGLVARKYSRSRRA